MTKSTKTLRQPRPGVAPIAPASAECLTGQMMPIWIVARLLLGVGVLRLNQLNPRFACTSPPGG